MKRFFRVAAAGIALGLALCVSDISAQDDTGKPNISGGVLNGRAISLPAPEYPAAARAVKAEGAVNIEIMVDEKGKVLSAKAVSGHPLLRQAAEKAALQAEFSPTVLDGKPVKVTGIVVYNFSSAIIKNPKIIAPVDAPNPEYPSAARAVEASGKVSVLVTISEKGEVVSAKAASGHPLLRRASEEAARQAKFSPFLVDKKPVQVTTILTYEFTSTGATRLVKKRD